MCVLVHIYVWIYHGKNIPCADCILASTLSFGFVPMAWLGCNFKAFTINPSSIRAPLLLRYRCILEEIEGWVGYVKTISGIWKRYPLIPLFLYIYYHLLFSGWVALEEKQMKSQLHVGTTGSFLHALQFLLTVEIQATSFSLVRFLYDASFHSEFKLCRKLHTCTKGMALV